MPVPSVSAAQQALVGQTIDNGSLRLLDTLGCGGFGAVFRAIAPKGRGPSNTRVFAVKVIAKKSESRAAQEQMRELAYHKRVSSHPNVVTLHRHFSDSTFIYVVLDVVLGGDLFTAIVDKATYYCNEGLTKKIFVQILDAVAWCHSRGVFHRDLKPENVLLSSNGLHAYLTDFGLATENKISKTFGVGSRAYMSPQVINEDMDCDSYSTPHNDIWALGCVLLNMLAGCGLWKRAVYADRTFMLYRQDRNLLHEALPITKSAGRILRRVFTMDTAKRISLAHLRLAVIEVDRMYLTSDELNLATEEVQDIADRAIKTRVAALEAESDLDSYIASSRSRASVGELQCIDGPTLINHTPSLPSPVMVHPPTSLLDSRGDPPVNRYSDLAAGREHSNPSRGRATARRFPPAVAVTPPLSDASSNLSTEDSLSPAPSVWTTSAPITPETRAIGDAAVSAGRRSVENLALPPSVACEERVESSALELGNIVPIPPKAHQEAENFMGRFLYELREDSDSE